MPKPEWPAAPANCDYVELCMTFHGRDGSTHERFIGEWIRDAAVLRDSEWRARLADEMRTSALDALCEQIERDSD